MIRIDNLTVAFGGVTALNGVTVDLNSPVIGIIGPNGAGKTTLLNVLSGFVMPRTGSIEVDGTVLSKMPPYRRAQWGIRRSFQKEQVVDQLTVEDNVRVILDSMAISRSEREDYLVRALEFTGISDLRHTKAASLNAMQRRMVELARCCTGKPKLLMLDEPGAGFSQTEVDHLRSVITGIKAFNGATTLLIDHDVDLIQATCPTTMVLDFGSLIAVGDTASVLTDSRVRAVYLGEEEIA